MISIGLTVHTEREVVDIATEATTSVEEAMGTAITTNSLRFVDWDREEDTAEADEDIKGHAKGNVMSVDD